MSIFKQFTIFGTLIIFLFILSCSGKNKLNGIWESDNYGSIELSGENIVWNDSNLLSYYYWESDLTGIYTINNDKIIITIPRNYSNDKETRPYSRSGNTIIIGEHKFNRISSGNSLNGTWENDDKSLKIIFSDNNFTIYDGESNQEHWSFTISGENMEISPMYQRVLSFSLINNNAFMIENEQFNRKVIEKPKKTRVTRGLNSFESISKFLTSESGGTSEYNPLSLKVNIDLQNMLARDSGWKLLLDLINTQGKYIALDLSGSTMPNKEFDPDSNYIDGKKFIIELILPDVSDSIASNNSFKHFSNITSIKGNNVNIIDNNTFSGIRSLEKVDFPEVIRIYNSAFSGCNNLNFISFPKAERIGENAFFGCTRLTSISFPLVTRIDRNAFYDCNNLSRASFPMLDSIYDGAFSKCDNLISVTLGTISEYNFSNVPKEGAYRDIGGDLHLTPPARLAYYGVSSAFPGDLREVYFSEYGGAGTYRAYNTGRNATWSKQ